MRMSAGGGAGFEVRFIISFAEITRIDTKTFRAARRRRRRDYPQPDSPFALRCGHPGDSAQQFRPPIPRQRISCEPEIHPLGRKRRTTSKPSYNAHYEHRAGHRCHRVSVSLVLRLLMYICTRNSLIWTQITTYGLIYIYLYTKDVFCKYKTKKNYPSVAQTKT